jgi:hypothetical protein
MRWAAAAGRSAPEQEFRPASGQAIRPAAAAHPVHAVGAVFAGPAGLEDFQAAARPDGRASAAGSQEVRLASGNDNGADATTFQAGVVPSVHRACHGFVRALVDRAQDCKQHDMAPRSRRAFAPELCVSHVPLKTEGAGKAGCPPHPRPPCVKMHGEGTAGGGGVIRPSLRNGFTAYTRSPRGPGLLAPVMRERLFLSVRALGASVGAPGPHDFAVRDNFGRLAQKAPDAVASTASRLQRP